MTVAIKKNIASTHNEIKKQYIDHSKNTPELVKRSSSNTVTENIGNNQDTCLNGIGPYEFIKPLGSGKFSKVMLAYHLETHQQVAIKIIDKQAHDYRVMSRLVREISLMEVLQHEYIVKLYETFESCDSLFIVMEYIPGLNLDEYLQKKPNGALDENEARHLFRQLVSAVDYCHHKWIVHRDLKTPNVLVTPDGTVKLADFGLGNRYGLQRLRTICGSMLYYSPEIITGQKYYGPEVDSWCLGITLFRMTAGFEPFSHAHTVGELKRDVCKGNFPIPTSLSPELQATIRKCLQVDRRKRMTVRQVLKDDPWLTASGTLPCPISKLPKTAFEETLVGDSEKEMNHKDDIAHGQFIRDIESDLHTSSTVKKTVIYHPINPSTYYTAKAGSSQTISSGQFQNIELLRSELLQSIRSRARRLGIKSAERWELGSAGLKLLFSSLNPHQKKRDSAPTTNGSSITGKRSITEIVQRMTKDLVYHFQIANQNVQPSHSQSSRPPSLSSSTSGSSISSSFVDDSALSSFEEDQEKRHHRELMLLLKQTCQLMGITYVQDSPTSLQCVLTLRNTPKTNIDQRLKQFSPSPTTTNRANSNSPVPYPLMNTRKQSQTSSVTTNLAMDESRQNKRLSLPLLSHLTSSMTTSLFGRNKPRHSLDESAAIIQPKEHHMNPKKKQKEGMAMFTIEIENHKKKSDRVHIRFSKQYGSTTVFKMAGGWVTGVVGLDGKIGR